MCGRWSKVESRRYSKEPQTNQDKETVGWDRGDFTFRFNWKWKIKINKIVNENINLSLLTKKNYSKKVTNYLKKWLKNVSKH